MQFENCNFSSHLVNAKICIPGLWSKVAKSRHWAPGLHLDLPCLASVLARQSRWIFLAFEALSPPLAGANRKPHSIPSGQCQCQTGAHFAHSLQLPFPRLVHHSFSATREGKCSPRDTRWVLGFRSTVSSYANAILIERERQILTSIFGRRWRDGWSSGGQYWSNSDQSRFSNWT